MSLAHSQKDIPQQNYKDVMFVGKVFSNQDPMQRERIQVVIPELMDLSTYNAQTLPWCFPKARHFSIGGGFGWFGEIPNVNSYVYVEFQDGNLNYPVYLGAAPDPANVISEALVNYPNRFGFKDGAGNLFYVDKSTSELMITMTTGVVIHATAAGGLTISGNDKLQATFTGDVNVTTSGNLNATVAGTANITASGQATVKGASVVIDGGGGNIMPCVTKFSICALTGLGHIDGSPNVKASQ